MDRFQAVVPVAQIVETLGSLDEKFGEDFRGIHRPKIPIMVDVGSGPDLGPDAVVVVARKGDPFARAFHVEAVGRNPDLNTR